MRPEDILVPTPSGVCCKPGGFHIDPTRPVEKALITHGHSDHARAGHGAVLATQETLDIMRLRYGDNFAGRTQAIRYGEKMRARFMRNAPFRFTPQDWFYFFASHGWRPREVRYLFDEARRLGRPVPLPWFLRLSIGIVRFLVSPARRERMNRFAAYVMLEPR